MTRQRVARSRSTSWDHYRECRRHGSVPGLVLCMGFPFAGQMTATMAFSENLPRLRPNSVISPKKVLGLQRRRRRYTQGRDPKRRPSSGLLDQRNQDQLHCAPHKPIVLPHPKPKSSPFIMQYSFISALLISICALVASAAPVPVPEPAVLPVAREIEHAPFVGIHDVARAIAPALQPKDESAVEGETEEARSCRLYSCIW
ncbi:hypothetical protein C8F01DRAFT_1260032 [Mycena amicta]|nr:hypothetical protein C8F01DRAFT_1260032 [Mycena amicta]